MTRLLKSAAWLASGLVVMVAGPLSAQDADILADPMDGEVESGANAMGSYAGVKAGGEQLPAIPATPGATPAAITWPGFQMQPDGGSRVFLQATTSIATQAHSDGKTFTLDLGNALIAGDTNALPLDTRFFNTPVTRIVLERVKGRLSLVLQLRAPVTPTVTTERVASGFHFIYVDFPPGSYIEGSTPTAAARKPPPQREPPSHLAGEIKAGGKVDTSMDAELPPGMGKTKASGKVEGKAGAGKASGKVEGKAGFSL